MDRVPIAPRRFRVVVLLGLLAAGLGGALRGQTVVGVAELSSLRFVAYTQPSAHHGDFWNLLDFGMLEADLALLRADHLNGLAIPIPFGSFVHSVDGDGFAVDLEPLARLEQFLDAAERHGLITVLWINEHRLPQGVTGTLVEGFTDPAGVRHPPFTGYYADGLSIGFGGDSRWRAFLGLCAAVAKVAHGRAVIWDALDWQYTLVHPFQLADPEVLSAWRRHLQGIDEDPAAWLRRWEEPPSEWEEIRLPVSASSLAAIEWHASRTERIRTDSRAARAREMYSGIPPTPPESMKWRDYSDWRDGLNRQLHGEVVAVLRAQGATPIGLRVDVDRWSGPEDWAAVSAVAEVDFTMFPALLPVADPEALRRELAALTAVTGKPAILWETVVGRSDRRWAVWSESRELAARLGVGIGPWAWRDSYFDYHTDRDHGLRAITGARKEDRPEVHLLDRWTEARIEPRDRALDTPGGMPAFLGHLQCGVEQVAALYTVGPSIVTLPLPPVAGVNVLELELMHPLAVGDGATARVTSGKRLLWQARIDPRPGEAACPWRSVRVVLPSDSSEIRLETRVHGDELGDWLAWRALRIVAD